MTAPQACVSVVQSSKFLAEDITFEDIKNLIRNAVQKAGGLEFIIQDGDTVILKPNLITSYDQTNLSRDLPPEVNGMTTDWRVAKAVVELVREINPNGQVYILEGVANGTTRENMEKLNYTSQYISGVDDFIWLEERSGGWREWDSPFLADVVLPAGEGKYPDYKKPNQTAEFYLNKIYYQADVVISLPVLKNHSQSNITGAIKNVGIGATPANIYGGIPGDNHRFVNNTIDHAPFYLHRWIHDYYLCRPVDFVIMDGLQGSSDGPVGITGDSLKAVQENMRLILAGADAIAVDAIASLIMGYNPERITHLALLHQDSAGCSDPRLIRVEGILLDEVKKVFDNGIRSDVYAWYSDFTGPSFSIQSIHEEYDTLYIGLSVDNETVKVEAMVDTFFLGQIAVDQFDDIRFDIDHIPWGNHSITIFAYDKYLNSTSETLNLTTSVQPDNNRTVESFQLMQNYPNPFNLKTAIKFFLPKSSSVHLTVYDISGKRIRVLIAGEVRPAGQHSITWDGIDESGRETSSGVYFYRLETEGYQDVKSMILLK
jgi:uncharacterized protein (DUF362 family)